MSTVTTRDDVRIFYKDWGPKTAISRDLWCWQVEESL